MKKILSILLVAATLTASAQVTTNLGGGSAGGGGGSYTASNGIGISGSVIKLGGVLTQATSVGGGNYDFSFNNKVYNNTSQRINIYTDTISFTLNGSRFLHTTSNGGGGWNYGNMWMGFGAGQTFGASSTGYANTGFGRYVMRYLDGTSATAASNAAFGNGSMESMTVGMLNTSVGVASMGLVLNSTGIVAVGHHAGLKATGSNNSVFVGRSAGDSCTAIEIVAVGHYALAKNSGLYNTSIGTYSGYESTIGTKNTHVGWSAGRNNTTPTENTLVGYLAGGVGVGTSGYNTCIGTESGRNITSGNTNTLIGRLTGYNINSGVGNVMIGNNAGANGIVNITTGSNNICIGNNTSISAVGASNELNIGNSIFGQNMTPSSTSFTTPRLSFGKRATTANSTLDMGLCSLPIILPKTGTKPSVGLETAMLYYNTNTNNIDYYDGNSWSPIQKEQPTTTVTSAGGTSWGSDTTPQVILNATSNSITQTIPAHNADYKNWVVQFSIINAASNTVTFNIPSSAYLNGVSGSTSFNAANGNVVTVTNDGTQWIITNK